MAPYVTKVELVNETEYKINWIGASTFPGLDGQTSVNGMEVLSGQTMSTDITKSGGTDGLFTMLSWNIAHTHVDIKSQFSVYCEMPATAGKPAFFSLIDLSYSSHGPLRTGEAFEMYRRMYDKSSSTWVKSVDRNGTSVRIPRVIIL